MNSGGGNAVEERQSGKEVEIIEETKEEIPRTIGLIGGVSFIVGSIIGTDFACFSKLFSRVPFIRSCDFFSPPSLPPGSGIFVSPKGVAMNSGSIGMTIMTWLICGVVSLLGTSPRYWFKCSISLHFVDFYCRSALLRRTRDNHNQVRSRLCLPGRSIGSMDIFPIFVDY